MRPGAVRPGSAPVVGIVGNDHDVARPWGVLPVTATPSTFVAHVLAAGGRPLILPGSAAAGLLDLVDAVVLTGGGDVHPERYGAPAADARDVDPDRDEAELEVVHRAAEAGIPLLGVCRGLQVMAVAGGGTLRADLEETHLLGFTGHRVLTEERSLIGELLGAEAFPSSLHRQAVADPGPWWRPTAWSAGDRVIEAVEWTGSPARGGAWPALGVQWHPELDVTGAALFGWLVGAASTRRTAVA